MTDKQVHKVPSVMYTQTSQIAPM